MARYQPRLREFTRREAIYLMGGTLVWIGCGGPGLDLGLEADDTFDDVLDKIHTTDPELNDDGLSNHAPMAAEALVAMGAADRVVEFVDDYDESLRLMQSAAPLPDADTQGALGDRTRRAEWIARYEDELVGGDVQEIVARELAELAPGMAAGAFHPLLRLAHAVRSFGRGDTVSRRREIAHAIGYWRATYHELPGVPGASPSTGFGIVDALGELPIVARGDQIHEGLILDRLGPAVDNPAWREVIERVDLDAQPFDEALTELCAASARYMVDDGQASIALLHAITGPSCLRLLAHLVDEPTQRLLLGHAFHVCAAIFSAQAAGPLPSAPGGTDISEADLVSGTLNELVDHTIKLTEAVIRENDVSPRSEFLRAGRVWLER